MKYSEVNVLKFKRDLQRLSEQIVTANAEIEQKNAEIEQKNAEIEQKRAFLVSFDERLSKKLSSFGVSLAKLQKQAESRIESISILESSITRLQDFAQVLRNKITKKTRYEIDADGNEICIEEITDEFGNKKIIRKKVIHTIYII